MKSTKKLLSGILSSAIFLSSASIYADTQTSLILKINNPIMTVNGIEKEIDSGISTSPVIINGRTLLPIRAVIEEIGGTVNWNEERQEITLTYGQDTIRLVIGNTTAYLNDNANVLDAAPTIINGRTMLPIRFIAESFNFNVEWNSETQTVTITKEEKDLLSEQPTITESSNNTVSNSTENKSNNENKSKALLIKFGHNGDTFTLNLENNETVEYLTEFIGTSEMNLPVYHFDDYDGYEYMQYYDIPSRYTIPANATKITSAKAGEVYYADNKVILFYQDAEIDGNYTKIGIIENTNGLKTAVEENPVLEDWGNKIISISPAD